MGLFKRMSGLVKADLNDLVDRCENPEKMLRQAVREMETALGQLMDGAARAIAHHKLLSRQLSDEKNEVERCTKSAEAFVIRGDDPSARRELFRKAEHQRLAEVLERQVTNADEIAERLRRQVTAMRMKLSEARRKLVDISARNRAAAAQRKFVDHLPSEHCAGTAQTTFEAMCSRVEQSEAETEALLELLGNAEPAFPSEADVEDELRAMKEAFAHATH